MFKIKLQPLFSLFIIFSSFGVFATQHSEALCIKNERANLRKGPGTQHDKLWEVFKYEKKMIREKLKPTESSLDTNSNNISTDFDCCGHHLFDC